MTFKKLNKPPEMASWLIFIGGFAMCMGNAVSHESPGLFFWNTGEWFIGFAVVYSVMGWWR